MFPLWKQNFAYRWSYVEMYNTAVLGLNKINNASMDGIYNRAIKPSQKLILLIDALHPIPLSSTLQAMHGRLNQNSLLKMHHSLLFDPAWLCFDGAIPRQDTTSVCGFAEFNNRQFINASEFDVDRFFPGAFTYHLHLKNCGKNIINGSYFVFIEDYFRSLLKAKLNL